MARPQQEELSRSGHNALEPEGPPPGTPGPDSGEGRPGLVPEANRPGHHPDHDQDKPDLDDFAERLGIDEPEAPPRGPDLRTIALVGAGVAVTVGLVVTAARILRNRGGDVADAVGRAGDRVGDLGSRVGDLGDRATDLVGDVARHTPLARPSRHEVVVERAGDLVGDVAAGLAARAPLIDR